MANTAPAQARSALLSTPKDFLKGPAPNPSITRIDFATTPLKEYDGLYATVLDGILTPEECHTFVTMAEATTNSVWERALINVGGGRQMMIEDTRKCGRIIWDDQEIVNRLWDRVKSMLPELQEIVNQPDVSGDGPARRREVWKMTRLNERMRFLKYTAGEYFKPHCDGMYETEDGRERTYYTLHLYLNDAEHQPVVDEPLEGGATTFWSMWGEEARVDVQPKIGSVLIFQQRHLLHAGDDLISGTKITLRTELMYECAEELAPKAENVKSKGKNAVGWVSSRIGSAN